MKARLITILTVLFMNISFAQTQELTEDQLKDQVSQVFKESYSKCLSFDPEAINYEIIKKKEFWSICKLKKRGS